MCSTSGLKELFGKELQGKDGVKVSTDDIKAKHIGIYFSAHWCPPCRNFTPKLATFYENCKKMENILEIIFVSSDRDEEGFEEYFGEMPWLALPYDSKTKKDELATKYNVRGIPKLVIINSETLETYMEDGRQEVLKCKTPENFKWIE